MNKKAKIICTLGPAVDSEEAIKQLILNGMNCARLNFSHGTYQEQKRRIDLVKKLREELKTNIAILLDTRGPEIRLKNFMNEQVQLKEGQLFTLTARDIMGNEDMAAISYTSLAKYISNGTTILIDDGKISMDVVDIQDQDVICKVITGGTVSNHKGINIPNVTIPMPFINEIDKNDILFGIENNVDFIAASFVRTKDDVLTLRELLNKNNGKHVKIISKIENYSGIKNIDKIIDVTDGIMVARGDMGVEIPFIKLPAIQKDIIKKSIVHGKYVITATQMLESMTSSPIPTRAEVSDVANAIYDGSTVVMLSGETAAGKYPFEAVKVMSEIIETAEENMEDKFIFSKNKFNFGVDISNAISLAACQAASQLNAKAIVVITRSGKTARLIASYRPSCPIIASVVDSKRTKHLSLARGVTAVNVSEQTSSDMLFACALETAEKTGLIETGDTIIIVAGSSVTKKAPADMLKILTV